MLLIRNVFFILSVLAFFLVTRTSADALGCGTVAPCLFAALEVNATYANGTDFKWTVPKDCLTALGTTSTSVYLEGVTSAATRYCTTSVTTASPETGVVLCRGLSPNTAYNVAIDLGSCARRIVRISTPGMCVLSSASLDCSTGTLSFKCSNGSSVVIEVRRPSMDVYGAPAYPADWTTAYLNVNSSPFTIPGLQPLDQVRLKTIIGPIRQGRWFTMSCPPPGTFTTANQGCIPQNVAVYGVATQSSTHYGGPAANAIDGNTNSSWVGASISHTESEPQPWWKVVFDQLYQVSQVVIFPRLDCCTTRLSNFDVTLRDPYGAVVATWYQSAAVTSPLTLNVNGAGVGASLTVQLRGTDVLNMAEVRVLGCALGSNTTNSTCAAASDGTVAQVVCPAGSVITNVTEARYGLLSGSCASSFANSGYCTAADVRVMALARCAGQAMCTMLASVSAFNIWDPCPYNAKTLALRVTCGCPSTNLAPLGTASQSSDANGAVAQRAIDGNTNGIFSGSSVTLTNNTNTPWWKVTLDRSYELSQIVIFPRTDCCQSRLANFDVTLRDANGGLVTSLYVGPALTAPLTLSVAGFVALSVTIQLRSTTDPLSLAEVQVMACKSAISTTSICMLGSEWIPIRMECPPGQVITSITEATFGVLTSGSCASTFSFGCSLDVRDVFLTQSINAKYTYMYGLSSFLTGVDPCPGFYKALAVRGTCGDTPVAASSSTPCARALDTNYLTVSCPAGQVITNFTWANYGPLTGSCAGGFYLSSTCNSDVRAVLNSAYIGLPSMSVFVWPSNLGGDPCQGTVKTLAVRATCGIGSGLPTSVSTCAGVQDGSTAELMCPVGQVITSVVEANYGTVAGSCASGFFALPTCNVNVTASVLSKCFMRQSCSIPVWVSTFTTAEPCPGVPKSLGVRVTCGSLPAPTAGGSCSVMPDYTNVTLSCPASQYISTIVQSDYGLIAGSCASRFYVSPECSASFLSTRMVVAASCLGQASCSVPTSPTVFDLDGCPSVQRSLAVNVTCGTKPCGTTTIGSAGQCLDLNLGADLSKDSGVNLIQWPCSGAQNQKWLIVPRADGVSVQLVNMLSGLCAGVVASAYWDPVNQLQCDAAEPLQAWTIKKALPLYGFQLKGTNWCMSPVAQPSGAPLYILNTCNIPTITQQLFSLTDAAFNTCSLTTY